MAQQTYVASRMFSMLPLAIPFVGIVAPPVSAPVAGEACLGLPDGPDKDGTARAAEGLRSTAGGPGNATSV